MGTKDTALFETVDGNPYRAGIESQAEFYNLTNSRNFWSPDGIMTSANFLNQWGTDGGDRRVVLGLRYVF